MMRHSDVLSLDELYKLTLIPHNQDCSHDIISVGPLLVVLHFSTHNIFKSGCTSPNLSSGPINCLWVSVLKCLDTFVHIFQNMCLCWKIQYFSKVSYQLHLISCVKRIMANCMILNMYYEKRVARKSVKWTNYYYLA